MKKIPTLFVRDEKNKLVTPEITPGCEWIHSENVIATRKYDGTCCKVKMGKLYKRYEMKYRAVSENNYKKRGWVPEKLLNEFEPSTEIFIESFDLGKQIGWLPVGDGPEDQWHREGFEELKKFYDYIHLDFATADGTYELVGPKIQGNFEDFDKHTLIRHGVYVVAFCPKDFEGIKKYLTVANYEGIVWYHPDGRMTKIKKKDFGIERKHPSECSYVY